MSSAAYAQTKRIENRHLTRERDRRRGRELATYLLVGLPVACALLVYAALHVETVRVGYAREARVGTFARLQEENRRLKADLSRASTPERAAALAARKRFKPAAPGQIQHIDSAPLRRRTR